MSLHTSAYAFDTNNTIKKGLPDDEPGALLMSVMGVYFHVISGRNESILEYIHSQKQTVPMKTRYRRVTSVPVSFYNFPKIVRYRCFFYIRFSSVPFLFFNFPKVVRYRCFLLYTFFIRTFLFFQLSKSRQVPMFSSIRGFHPYFSLFITSQKSSGTDVFCYIRFSSVPVSFFNFSKVVRYRCFLLYAVFIRTCHHL